MVREKMVQINYSKLTTFKCVNVYRSRSSNWVNGFQIIILLSWFLKFVCYKKDIFMFFKNKSMICVSLTSTCCNSFLFSKLALSMPGDVTDAGKYCVDCHFQVVDCLNCILCHSRSHCLNCVTFG